MTTDVYPHFPAGHPLFTSTVERVSVSQRTTKAGDVLYVFTLPCSPGLKSDILECLIRHHAGQLPLDLGRMGPARAFACPAGARDAADTLSLVRIDLSHGDSGINTEAIHRTLSPHAPGMLWVAKVNKCSRNGTSIVDSASSTPGHTPHHSSLTSYSGSSEFVALFSGCHDFLSTGQSDGFEFITVLWSLSAKSVSSAS